MRLNTAMKAKHDIYFGRISTDALVIDGDKSVAVVSGDGSAVHDQS